VIRLITLRHPSHTRFPFSIIARETFQTVKPTGQTY